MSRRCPHALAAMAIFALPSSSRAEPGSAGYLHFGPGALFTFAAILALPTAAAAVATELIVPRRHVPGWLGISSGTVALLALAIALKGISPQASHSDSNLLWFLIPPFATLALRAALPDAQLRLGIGWAIALAALGSAFGLKAGSDLLVILGGGATVCLLGWSLCVAHLWMRHIAPEPARSRRSELRGAAAAFGPLAGKLREAGKPLFAGAERALQPAQKGLLWWLGATLAFYFGVGAMIAAGKLSGGLWIYSELQQLFDTFALPQPRLLQPKQLWWFVGLPWSLAAGAAVWGLAGTCGLFNPGRARIMRFAGVVFGGALLIWTAAIIVQMKQTEAAEESAVGRHR